MPIITECHSPSEGTVQGGGPVTPQTTHKPAQHNGPSSDGNNVSNQITSSSSDAGASVSGDRGSPVFTTVCGTTSHFSNTTPTFSTYNVGSPFTVPPPTYMVYGGILNNSGSAHIPAGTSFGTTPPGSGKSMPPPGVMPPPQLLPPPLPPPIYNVNISAAKSLQPNGQDLPLNDMHTLRFFFNLGVEYMWWWINSGGSVGGPVMGSGGLMPAHSLPPQHHNLYVSVPHQSHLGHLSYRGSDINNDLSQELQNLSFMDRGPNSNNSSNQGSGKFGNKNNNKQENNNKGGHNNQQGKGLGQNQNQGLRGTPLGPRFKRGDGMVGGKGNGNNKGNNNMRRGSYGGPPNMQSSGGSDNCIGCCDDQVIIGGPPPQSQPSPYYTYGLHEDLMMSAPLIDPSAAYLLPGLPAHYLGYGRSRFGYAFDSENKTTSERMGANMSSPINSNQPMFQENILSIPMEETVPNNGLVFNGIFLPEEIFILILDFVDSATLLKTCKKVCQKWEQLTMEVFKIKSVRRYPVIANLKWNRIVPTYLYENIALTKAYDVNLLKNGSGEHGLKYWKIKLNGGDRWIVERPPSGTSVPIDGTLEYSPSTCFCTSYRICAKEQIIDLYKYGLEARILDTFQPDITASEVYAGRFDCRSFYCLKVCLLDNDKRKVKDFEFRASLTAGMDNCWKKVKHTFTSYGPGVKFVSFLHEGCDTQFWAGHYGSKMSEASVSVSVASLFDNIPHL